MYQGPVINFSKTERAAKQLYGPKAVEGQEVDSPVGGWRMNVLEVTFPMAGSLRKSLSTLDALEDLLQSVEEDIDNSDAVYKLRSTRPLVEVLKQRQDDRDKAIEDAIDDEEVLDNLRDLGSL